MQILVAGASAASGWDKATALGTIFAAAIAAGALVYSLYLGRRESRRAEQDRADRAMRREADDRRLSEESRRQFELGVLLRISDDAADAVASGRREKDGLPAVRVMLALRSLPGNVLTVMRVALGEGLDVGAGVREEARRRSGSTEDYASLDWLTATALQELADNIAARSEPTNV